MTLLYLLCATPMAVLVLSLPETILVLTIALFASDITIPRLPAGLNLFYLTAALISVLLPVSAFISRRQVQSKWPPPVLFLIIFAGVLIFTAALRGTGLQILGTKQWGGRIYIQLLIGVSVVLASRYVCLTENHWKHAVLGLFLFGLSGGIAQLIFTLSNGQIYQHLMLFENSGNVAPLIGSMRSSPEMLRIQNLSLAPAFFCMWALCIRPQGILSLLYRIALACIVVGSIGIAGHRISLAYVALIPLIFHLIRPGGKIKKVLATSAGIAAILFVFSLFATSLPLPFQRVLTLVPYAEVSPIVKADTAESAMWRLEIWKRVWEEVPNYLWLGKGFTFSGSDFALSYRAVNTWEATIRVAIECHNYHNGPLGLLLDLGILGLLSASCFMIAVCVRHSKLTRQAWKSAMLARFHVVFLSLFIAQTLIFWFLYGDMKSLIQLMVWFTVLEGLAQTDAHIKPPPSPIDTNARDISNTK